MENIDADKKISRAKTQLILREPFFQALVCTLPLVENEDIPTMATNGFTIYWNREFVDTLSVNEVVFVLCHEVLHVVFEHVARLNNRNMRRWNYATDYIINKTLVEDGVGTMPAMGLRDDDLVNRCGGVADRVYNELGDDDDEDGAGQGFDQLMPGPADPAQQAQQAADVAIAISQASQIAKAAGNMSGNVARIIDSALKPVVNWRAVVQDFIISKAKDERSYAVMNNRNPLPDEILVPGKTGEAMGPIVMAVDCSGSVDDKSLQEMAAEIFSLHEQFRPTSLTIIYFDHEVSHVDTYGPDDTPDIRAHGGGGTAFSPIFRKIDELDLDPVGVVVLTDLYCNDYGPVPSYPVLWACTDYHESRTVPWGQIVPIEH
jgi:predicted metal-dependent peptidase